MAVVLPFQVQSGQGSGAHRCPGGWLWLWGGCSKVSRTLLGRDELQDMPLGVRASRTGPCSWELRHLSRASQGSGAHRCSGEWSHFYFLKILFLCVFNLCKPMPGMYGCPQRPVRVPHSYELPKMGAECPTQALRKNSKFF